MPLNVQAVVTTLKTEIRKFEKRLLDALSRCRDQLAAGNGGTALQRWFGDSTPAFRKEVKEKIAKMRSHLNSLDIPCQMGLGLSAGNNAVATHLDTGLLRAGGMSTLQAVQAVQAGGKIEIGPNFKNLPDFATASLATYRGQDKFQTVAHELSHYVLGTRDETNDDGGTAYGGARARLLVMQDRDAAKTNAENWGFFVEEFA